MSTCAPTGGRRPMPGPGAGLTVNLGTGTGSSVLEVVRAFEAGPDGLEFLVFGPHHEADGEQVDDAWVA